MDYVFRDILQTVLEMYEDDLMVYSKIRKDHIKHLRQVFERCRRYGISLNPKKSILGVVEGKLLEHVITKEDVKIDPDRVKSIKEISLPKILNALRSLFGKINFIHSFIPNFADINKTLNKLIKKGCIF